MAMRQLLRYAIVTSISPAACIIGGAPRGVNRGGGGVHWRICAGRGRLSLVPKPPCLERGLQAIGRLYRGAHYGLKPALQTGAESLCKSANAPEVVDALDSGCCARCPRDIVTVPRSNFAWTVREAETGSSRAERQRSRGISLLRAPLAVRTLHPRGKPCLGRLGEIPRRRPAKPNGLGMTAWRRSASCHTPLLEPGAYLT
jgi:hypothetical protein